jgi:NTE family protein
MGAIVGGMYACGMTPDEIMNAIDNFNFKKMFNPLNFDLTMKGLFNGNNLVDELGLLTNKCLIEECEIPFCAVAYDIYSRRSILINSGNIAKAMRASSSVPYVFKPFKYSKYLFLDGGVEYPVPVNFTRQLYPDMPVIAVNVQEPLPKAASFFEEEEEPKGKSELSFIESMLESVYGNQAYLSVNEILVEQPDIVINTYSSKYTFKDFGKVKEFYELGRRTAEKAIHKHLEEQRMYDPLYVYRKRIEKIKQSILDKLPIFRDI